MILTDLPTPAYLYDMNLLKHTVHLAASEAARNGFVLHYSMKANYLKPILEVMKDHSLGIDSVSGNEIALALETGFKPQSIVFAGPGKTDTEILAAIKAGIFCLNVESVEELEVIASHAESCQTVASVALRINPDVDGNTHQKITTGLNGNKFGIPIVYIQRALDLCAHSPYLRFMGLHFHIGSQIVSPEPFHLLARKASEIWSSFEISRYGATMLNLGGGLGVNYENPAEFPVADFKSFFGTIARNLQIPADVKVHFELGRSLVAQCGTLVTKVLFVKKGIDKQFVVVDAGMTELLRPAIYQALHKIENPFSDGKIQYYDVVGPVCESSDVFAKDYPLPETSRGDLLLIRSCGAYAQSMTLRYNLRSIAPAFFHHGEMDLPLYRLNEPSAVISV
ncbi:MAG TPA: diaminopimelate decarboxylase [Bacteroidales bacterium]|nr:diaminopimelate decarboxylase [Bacteroidales bacterium]